MVNTAAIKARCKAMKITQEDIAQVLGIKRCTVSQKINNQRPMTVTEAVKLQWMLDIQPEDFGFFFFGGEA